ncbi:MAG: methylated-DNA--[protein]-cysteine S-methyltransferase [Anaerorhabdus sp.]
MKKHTIETKLGKLLIIQENNCISEIKIQEDGVFYNDESELLTKVKIQIKEYFNGKRKKFDFPIVLKGTDFQKKVWSEMLLIPFGKTISYGDLARNVNNKKAFRAVGSCCNKNRLLLVVPCHRVIAKNNSIGGFAHGTNMKKLLLKSEGVEV